MIYDTIAAVATPISTASIGIIRISGEKAIQIADKIFISKKNKSLKDIASHTINYGHIVDYKNNLTVDEVLVSIMKAPNSFTKEDVIEINAHGGILVVQKILSMVLREGARLAEPGEFTKRAFLNGRIDLSQAEAVIDIINASTDISLSSSINQLKGSLSEKINEIKDMVIGLIGHIEASIDYPEYDIEEVSNDSILYKLEKVQELINHLLDSYDDGKIIKEGIKTTIIGKPNVGKSSLLNTLLEEERAIVTNIPGTTRDVLEEYMNIHGIPLKLIDTAGIRDANDLVEKIGIDKSKEKILDADLILFMLDASNELSSEDIEIFSMVKNKKYIVLLNKIDLGQKISLDKLKEYIDGNNIIPISVKTLEGIHLLKDYIKELFYLGNINFNDNVYITNVRHKNSLEKALISLENVKKGIDLNMPVDLLVIDLNNLYEAVAEITGDSIKEDLMHEIFSKFCLGK